jgi:hypothetical protein
LELLLQRKDHQPIEPGRGGAVPSQSLEPVTDCVVRKKFGGESEEPKNRPKAELIKKNPSPSLLRA